jgi:hypothetical protein
MSLRTFARIKSQPEHVSAGRLGYLNTHKLRDRRQSVRERRSGLHKYVEALGGFLLGYGVAAMAYTHAGSAGRLILGT